MYGAMELERVFVRVHKQTSFNFNYDMLTLNVIRPSARRNAEKKKSRAFNEKETDYIW